MNRRRRDDETYSDYIDDRKATAMLMRFRLKGRWIWKTFYPLHKNHSELPRGAVVYQRDEESGVMIISEKIDFDEQMHYVKFPPYHASKDGGRKTFSQQRTIARTLEAQLEQSKADTSETDGDYSIDDNAGGA